MGDGDVRVVNCELVEMIDEDLFSLGENPKILDHMQRDEG
jgi:hypothetical protein